MSKGTHEYRPDPRNREILIYVNGGHVPREEATVSVFDSGFVLGDGIWEGLRVHHGHIAFLDAHLDRLYEGAKALDLDIGLDTDVYTVQRSRSSPARSPASRRSRKSMAAPSAQGCVRSPVAVEDVGVLQQAEIFDSVEARRGRPIDGARSGAGSVKRRRGACTGGGQAPGLNPQATNRIAWPARSPARAGP